MRLNSEEEVRMRRVSRYYGLNAAGLIRMLVKREEEVVEKREERKKRVKEGKSPVAREGE